MTSKSRTYVCYWDCNGFETIADVSKWENESLLNTIAGKELTSSPINLHSLTMRARFNPQRSPEIWTFTTVYSITEDTLWEIAEENPQELVDMIRERGNKLFGEAVKTAPAIL